MNNSMTTISNQLTYSLIEEFKNKAIVTFSKNYIFRSYHQLTVNVNYLDILHLITWDNNIIYSNCQLEFNDKEIKNILNKVKFKLNHKGYSAKLNGNIITVYRRYYD